MLILSSLIVSCVVSNHVLVYSRFVQCVLWSVSGYCWRCHCCQISSFCVYLTLFRSCRHFTCELRQACLIMVKRWLLWFDCCYCIYTFLTLSDSFLEMLQRLCKLGSWICKATKTANCLCVSKLLWRRTLLWISRLRWININLPSITLTVCSCVVVLFVFWRWYSTHFCGM